MKKYAGGLIALMAALVVMEPFPALAEEISDYAPYSTHQELLDAYREAVVAGDVGKQEELLEIGRRSLDHTIAQVDGLTEEGVSTRTNPSPHFKEFFTKGEWITRSGVLSLSLYPINPILWSKVAAGNAWDAVVLMYSWSPKWGNPSVMKEQFFCHWTLASWKSPWNLEPSKTSINPITCN